MSDPEHTVRRGGGVAKLTSLQAAGHSRHHLRRAVDEGRLVRVRRNWVAVPEADALLVAAARRCRPHLRHSRPAARALGARGPRPACRRRAARGGAVDRRDRALVEAARAEASRRARRPDRERARARRRVPALRAGTRGLGVGTAQAGRLP
ncbi:type IV toxin-antitoxin system AbiEi family antitoxin domain-containing protein [Agromyces arachidis]|uniref:type IV toxin-antitoxin system AbiEi family antitoxin domain-containing protein n=1 Tax=Agromyces arachidis TaxID=766966 RepID=UPI004057522E